MSRRPISAFRLLIVVCLLCACDSAATPGLETLTPARPSPIAERGSVEPLQVAADSPPLSCGVGVLSAHARMWIAGPDAQRACSGLTILILQQGNEPTTWDGVIIGGASDYRPICVGVVTSVTYEVIDTGTHLLGTTWCHWAVQVYGASNRPARPDVFGIIGPAQETEAARQQYNLATSQAIATAKQLGDRATRAAEQQTYADGCREHNGYLENGFCLVDYTGSPKWRVTINYDGTWDAAQANANRRLCESAAQQAVYAAGDGHGWAVLPEYHDDTGVCIQGHP